jgi:hypothetical protein
MFAPSPFENLLWLAKRLLRHLLQESAMRKRTLVVAQLRPHLEAHLFLFVG